MVDYIRKRGEKEKLLIFTFILGLSSGICFTFVFYQWEDLKMPEENLTISTEKHQGMNGLLNPLLDCIGTEAGLASVDEPYLFEDLADNLEQFINERFTRKGVDGVSVYFRDMNNGPWAGINEGDLLRPGSLLKVPILIGYLKRSEKEAGLLKRKILFKNKDLLKLYDLQGVRPSQTLILGKSYTIDQLLESLIIRSDNVAGALLEEFDKKSSMRQTAQELDVPIRSGHPPYRKLTIKEYASFFRILYNGSYLNHEHSNLALRMMSRSEFREGLPAGVPKGIIVSHKFGEFFDASLSHLNFHDCGIVYFPPRPYLLCIKTEGKEKGPLIEAIRDISAYVFSEVEKSMPSPFRKFDKSDT